MLDLDRVAFVVEGHRVDRIDLVFLIEVRVEPVHHHVKLPRGRAAFLGIDDPQTVQAVVDVLRDWRGVAVVQVYAGGLGLELVDERAVRGHLLRQHRAVHLERVVAVKMHRVWPVAHVGEQDADALPFFGAQGRAGNLAVVGPGGEENTGGDLDCFVDDFDLEDPQHRAVFEGFRTALEFLGQVRIGVEAFGADVPDRGVAVRRQVETLETDEQRVVHPDVG